MSPWKAPTGQQCDKSDQKVDNIVAEDNKREAGGRIFILHVTDLGRKKDRRETEVFVVVFSIVILQGDSLRNGCLKLKFYFLIIYR